MIIWDYCSILAPLMPCQFEHNHLHMSHLHHMLSGPITHLLPYTMSIQAQPLMSCPHHVNSCLTTCLPPPLHLFKHNHSCPTSTMHSQAWSLVSHPTVSIWAQLLVSHLHQVLLSPIISLKIYFLITLFELVATLYRNDIYSSVDREPGINLGGHQFTGNSGVEHYAALDW